MNNREIELLDVVHKKTLKPSSTTRPDQGEWQLLATFGNFWQHLAAFGAFWLLLTHFGYFWLVLTTFG